MNLFSQFHENADKIPNSKAMGYLPKKWEKTADTPRVFPQKGAPSAGFFLLASVHAALEERGELDKTLGVTPRSLIPAACITLA